MKANKIVGYEDQDILTKASNISTSVFVTGLTSIGTFIQGLFLQYLYETVIIILCLRDLYKGISTIVYLILSLQLSLQVSLQKNILCCIYYGISTTVRLLLSLLTSLRCKVLQLSLHASLRCKFLQSSLLTSLRDDDLRSSLVASLRSGNLRSSLLTSMWDIFLQCLHKDKPTVTSTPSKPEVVVQGIHSKPEILKKIFWDL